MLLFLLVACLRLLRQPLRLALRVLLNSALGFCAVWLLNMTTAVTGMSLGLNIFNALDHRACWGCRGWVCCSC